MNGPGPFVQMMACDSMPASLMPVNRLRRIVVAALFSDSPFFADVSAWKMLRSKTRSRGSCAASAVTVSPSATMSLWLVPAANRMPSNRQCAVLPTVRRAGALFGVRSVARFAAGSIRVLGRVSPRVRTVTGAVPFLTGNV